MKSPEDMLIQIEITNACVNSCSHCTRHCGHHEKPFFMDFETFKKAVDSLRGFKGLLGLIGGEPTIHPEFAKFARYLRDNHKSSTEPSFLGPTPLESFWCPTSSGMNDWGKYVTPKNNLMLLSIAGDAYYKNFELIQDTFGVQALNSHFNPSAHYITMSTRKELGIPDDEWIKLRDSCSSQERCASVINPKGAFFCERAAALDVILDGPGGWSVEPEWWKRKPEEFGSQLDMCEMCGDRMHRAIHSVIPLRDCRSEIDEVSPVWYEILKKKNSPKLRKGLVKTFEPPKYNPDGLILPLFIDGNRTYTPQAVDYNALGGTKLFPNNILFISDPTTKVADLPKATGWVALGPVGEFEELLTSNVFNPGCFYWTETFSFFNLHAEALQLFDGPLGTIRDSYPVIKVVNLPSSQSEHYKDNMPYYTGTPRHFFKLVKPLG